MSCVDKIKLTDEHANSWRRGKETWGGGLMGLFLKRVVTLGWSQMRKGHMPLVYVVMAINPA